MSHRHNEPWPDEVRERALTMRRDGAKYREIQQALGVPMSTISAWEHDPSGEQLRARKLSYRGECIDCGGPTCGHDGRAAAPDRCSSCRRAYQREHRVWTRETIIEAIQAWAAEYGEPPRASDWNCAHRGFDPERYYDGPVAVPSLATVQTVFGRNYWTAAIRAAGFEPRPRGYYGRRGEEPAFRAEVAQLYRTGLSCTQVGERVGLSAQGVLHLLRLEGEPTRSPAEGVRLRYEFNRQAA